MAKVCNCMFTGQTLLLAKGLRGFSPVRLVMSSKRNKVGTVTHQQVAIVILDTVFKIQLPVLERNELHTQSYWLHFINSLLVTHQLSHSHDCH